MSPNTKLDPIDRWYSELLDVHVWSHHPEIRELTDTVIPPFLMGLSRRIHAAVFSFMAGVIPPIAMFGRSLLYVQSHFVA